MQWDWSRWVELGGFVVTVVSLHYSNLRHAEKNRDALITHIANLENKVTKLETKTALIYSWFRRHVVKIDGEAGRESGID